MYLIHWRIIVKKVLLTMAALLPLTGAVTAGPAAFAGITYGFGGHDTFGFTVKVVSSDEEDKTVAAAGVSYYPNTAKTGFDVGVGRNFDKSGLILGYDVINQMTTFSAGWVDTKSSSSSAPDVPLTIEKVPAP